MSPMFSFGQIDECLHHRLLDFFDVSHVRQKRRVVHVLARAVRERDVINHAGIRGDDVHVVFAAQAFLDDFHVEQAEEAAAESESQRHTRFG